MGDIDKEFNINIGGKPFPEDTLRAGVYNPPNVWVLQDRLEALEKKLDSFIQAFTVYASQQYEWGGDVARHINNGRDDVTQLARGLNKLSDYIFKGNVPNI